MTGFQQQRQQTGVPVVAVGDVGSETQLFARMQGRCGQKGKAFTVVGIGLVVLGIKLGAVEIVRAIEQIDADPVQFQLMDAIADITAILGGEPARGEEGGLLPALDGLVEGHNDAHIVPPDGRDAAAGPWPHLPGPGLHQPLNLRGYKQDFQWVNSQLLLPLGTTTIPPSDTVNRSLSWSRFSPITVPGAISTFCR